MKETTIQSIGLDKIRPSKTNPRKHFDENYIAELSDSIRAKGILQPLLARPDWCIGKTDEQITALNGDGERADAQFFEIVAGECRYRGASRAKLAEAPAIIRLLSDKETLEIQLIENLQRSDLTAVEEAEAYRRLIDEMGYTAELIHEKTGKALNTIYGKLKMLRAPKFLLDALEKGIIGERHCELVGRIPVPEMRERAGREILKPPFQEDPLNYRKAAAHVSDNYMRPLSGAQFDQRDAGLVSVELDEETSERIGGGACTDCPMKTGNRPELFGDLKRTDICTNPKCFNRKSDAHFALLQKTAEGQGKKLLTADEAAEIFEEGGTLWFDSPYVKLSDKPDPREMRSDAGLAVSGKIPTWAKLLEHVESKPQIAIAKDPRGRIVELVDRGLAIEAVNLAAKQKGEHSLFDLSASRAGSGSAGSSDSNATYQEAERKKREAAKLNFKITLAVMTELIGAIDKQGVVKGFWDALIEASITHAGHDGAWLICKRLGLDAKNHVKAEAAHVAVGVESAALEFGLTLPDEKFKLGFVVELLLSQRVKFSGNSGGLKSVEALKNFIDLYKIDVGVIERRVKDAGKSEVRSKKEDKAPPGPYYLTNAVTLPGERKTYGVVQGRGPGEVKNPYEEHGLTKAQAEKRLEELNSRGVRPGQISKIIPDQGLPNGGSTPPAPRQKFAKHKWENITGNKYHCRNCPAAAVKNVKGEIVPMNEFRGKPCVGTEKPSRSRGTSLRGKKCSHCSNRAAPGKSMCTKCLEKNASRAKARRAKKGGVKNG